MGLGSEHVLFDLLSDNPSSSKADARPVSLISHQYSLSAFFVHSGTLYWQVMKFRSLTKQRKIFNNPATQTVAN